MSPCPDRGKGYGCGAGPPGVKGGVLERAAVLGGGGGPSPGQVAAAPATTAPATTASTATATTPPSRPVPPRPGPGL
ncbi:hypothetical protein VULLAG_LOCUS16800 [Vulpes lagopus]